MLQRGYVLVNLDELNEILETCKDRHYRVYWTVFFNVRRTDREMDWGKGRRIIRRGQWRTGRPVIAKRANMSESAVRSALNWLQKRNLIAQETGDAGIIVTICDYNKITKWVSDDEKNTQHSREKTQLVNKTPSYNDHSYYSSSTRPPAPPPEGEKKECFFELIEELKGTPEVEAVVSQIPTDMQPLLLAQAKMLNRNVEWLKAGIFDFELNRRVKNPQSIAGMSVMEALVGWLRTRSQNEDAQAAAQLAKEKTGSGTVRNHRGKDASRNSSQIMSTTVTATSFDGSVIRNFTDRAAAYAWLSTAGAGFEITDSQLGKIDLATLLRHSMSVVSHNEASVQQ